ncbi:MAG: hypothetical protein A3D94_08045 [Alphaproteobacteria bacterium RIFCSPHIGHO2_12_FULL_66_14]|nr:MAG: hypothetical protein A3D94_08045 [Alphaproteobacteria bacterium RIFCSPHIGHO2_12_FULL_66_14]
MAGLLFIAIFTYKSFELCQRAIDVSPYFSLPRRLWYAARPISGFLMMLFSVRRLWMALAKEPTSIAR